MSLKSILKHMLRIWLKLMKIKIKNDLQKEFSYFIALGRTTFFIRVYDSLQGSWQLGTERSGECSL